MTDLLPLLQDFYRDKLAELLRHEAGARLVGQYDANNTYQYIIGREETQLSWVGAGHYRARGTCPVAGPGRSVHGRQGRGTAVVFEEDARAAQRFVDEWRPRVDAMSNARHRGTLRVILGETLEQKRFFEQALAGRTDLLGRRTADVGELVGSVMPTRWIE